MITRAICTLWCLDGICAGSLSQHNQHQHSPQMPSCSDHPTQTIFGAIYNLPKTIFLLHKSHIVKWKKRNGRKKDESLERWWSQSDSSPKIHPKRRNRMRSEKESKDWGIKLYKKWNILPIPKYVISSTAQEEIWKWKKYIYDILGGTFVSNLTYRRLFIIDKHILNKCLWYVLWFYQLNTQN